MSSSSWPNFTAWLDTAWGSGADYCAIFGWPNAANLVFGQNPPWALDDLLSLYPKFFGPAVTYTISTTAGSQTVTMTSTAGLKVGAFVQCSSLPAGSLITSVSTNSVTVNNAATSTAANVFMMAYANSPVPINVLSIYIALAVASLQAARWQEQWYIAVGWFVAHYATLWARSDAMEVIQIVSNSVHGEIPSGTLPGSSFTLSAVPPGGVLQSLTRNGLFLSPTADYMLVGTALTTTAQVQSTDVLYAVWPSTTSVDTTVMPTASQVAAQGLANGIQVSKSVGDVSASYQVLSALEDWGQWNLTLYGQMLATQARIVGMGPMVIW